MFSKRTGSWSVLWVLLPLLVVFARGGLGAEQRPVPIDDITGNYQFLSVGDTLAILDEEGSLSGYLDVLQGEDESDALLSYPLKGSRKGEHVEFKTDKIHQKYYRFSGTAQRGAGTKDTEPDYLRLVGDLEIVTLNSETKQESVERRQLTLQRMGKDEAANE
jgi:hypothetical protein